MKLSRMLVAAAAAAVLMHAMLLAAAEPRPAKEPQPRQSFAELARQAGRWRPAQTGAGQRAGARQRDLEHALEGVARAREAAGDRLSKSRWCSCSRPADPTASAANRRHDGKGNLRADAMSTLIGGPGLRLPHARASRARE